MFMGGLVVVMVILVLAVAAGFARREGDTAGSAERILSERFAAGEIDRGEYDLRRAQLARSDRPSGWSSPWLIAGAVLAVVVLVGALFAFGTGMGFGWMGGRNHMGVSDGSTGTSDEPVAGAPEATVVAGDLWFEPDTLEATAGEPLNITVTNEGAVFHDLTIDELDFMVDVEAGDSVTAGLIAAEPAEYEYYCSVPGHAQAGMTGTLVVAPAR